MTKLKIFADHCVPTYIINSLKDAGFEVYRLRDYIPKDSPDSIVIAEAQELNSILISLNGDFADIVTYPPANFKGIIALQVRNRPEIIPYIVSRLKEYLLKYESMEHYHGKLFLVEAHRIRIRQC
jgi:predicted nuclease of predicted toxin-antitoxin system